MAKKIYLLDTNVLVHDPKALFKFEDALIGIPSVVLEELDNFKGENTARGRNTREVIRYLDEIRNKGQLGDGVQLHNGCIVKVIFLYEKKTSIPFRMKTEDNEILLIAVSLKNQGYDVRFISKDLNARVKADALGVESSDYLKARIDEDQFYCGWTHLKVPSVQLKRELPDDVMELAHEKLLTINEFVLVESNNNPHNYRLFRFLGGKKFKPVHDPAFKWPLKARNPQQLMALDLLLDCSIQFISLFGPAGTGKTFLALLAGLHKTLIESQYEKILVSRPVVPLGRDIGYLPGTMQEKLHNWMLPVFDNMEFIVHSSSLAAHQAAAEGKKEKVKTKNGKNGKKHKREKKERNHVSSMEELMHQGKLSLEAITYMRGRSIPYQYIVIDEAQNLTPHEVKTLVSRVGEGSKIILAGDPYQIDSPYLDFSSNGLVIASEAFKGKSIFGSVYLEVSERSELSQLAGELL